MNTCFLINKSIYIYYEFVCLNKSKIHLIFSAIKKDQFKEMKNDHLEQEPFVICMDCGRKQHQICVLHHDQIWPQGFCCDNCLKKKGGKRKENKFSAKKLPTSKLGIYIETRVNNFLKKKEAGAGEVHIRVVASSDKVRFFCHFYRLLCYMTVYI